MSSTTGSGSLTTLLDELATRTRNTIRLHHGASFEQLTQPTETQAQALTLIDDYTPTT